MTAVIAGVILFSLWLVIAVVSALLIMWAWNLLLAELFGWPAIGFWHAVAVTVLLSCTRQVISVSVQRERKS